MGVRVLDAGLLDGEVMQTIEHIKVFRWLTVAWVESDAGEKSHKSVGFTARQARDRALESLIAEVGI